MSLPIFLTDREINLFNSLNEEIIEKLIGHTVIIYKIHPEYSKTNIYNESTNKVYENGIEIYGLIRYEEPEITTEFVGGLNQKRNIELLIQKKHLLDGSIFFEEGDLVFWDDQYFEITKITEPQKIQNVASLSHEIKVECISTDISSITIKERIK